MKLPAGLPLMRMAMLMGKVRGWGRVQLSTVRLSDGMTHSEEMPLMLMVAMAELKTMQPGFVLKNSSVMVSRKCWRSRLSMNWWRSTRVNGCGNSGIKPALTQPASRWLKPKLGRNK